MSFVEANTAYETWLRTQCAVVESDLVHKHKRMAKDAFRFLRATCFRWSAEIEALLADLATAPPVLAVGDCHIENFGTWRDGEARFVWGVNDFDDAAAMPYAFDLVRLATSARLAPERIVGTDEAVAAILEGYSQGLAAPRPMLIDEVETWIRDHVRVSDKARAKFWAEIDGLKACLPPQEVQDALVERLPPDAAIEKFAMRLEQGGGSLGRPRHVVVAHWRGGRVVRESKALVPSSWDYAHGRTSAASHFVDLARCAHRAFDPFLSFGGHIVVRRLWPDARKVDLGKDAGRDVPARLLKAMGADVGAVHAATPGAAAAIMGDLATRGDDWLATAAKEAAKAVEQDFAEWSAYWAG